MVTHLLGCAPLVVMAVMSESSSSFFSFSFFTRLSIALLAKLSLSPPCRWHIRLCTMLRQASLLVGVFVMDILARVPRDASCPAGVQDGKRGFSLFRIGAEVKSVLGGGGGRPNMVCSGSSNLGGGSEKS